jgi:hypothetical protein
MMRKCKALFQGKRKFVAIPLLLILIPTAAWAAFTFLFGMTGSVKTATVTPVIDQVSVTNQVDATCSITKADAKTVAVTITKAFPGAECSFRVTTTRPAAAQDALMVTQGITYVDSPYVTTKYAAGSCGVVVNDPNLSGSTNRLDFTVKVSTDAPMATTYPANAQAGFSLVPQASYVAASCPTW